MGHRRFVCAAVGMVALILASVPQKALGQGDKIAPAPSQPLSWGKEEDGLQVGVRLERPAAAFAPGELIWQEAYLRNRSRREVTVQLVGGYEQQGLPAVTDAKGRAVKVLQYFGIGAMFVIEKRVRPGEVSRVGRYALTFREPEQGGDTLHEVAPGLSSAAEEVPLALAGTGAYTLRQKIAVFDTNDRSVQKSLTAGPVSLKITRGPATHAAVVERDRITDLSTAPIAWGQEQSGLKAGLLFVEPKSHYAIGERVRLAVVLRNVSQRTISFRHQTSFAFLEPPIVTKPGAERHATALAAEDEWKSLHEIKMTGVTFDMTSAPSASGPFRLRESEIGPGQSVIGYYLTAFIVPSTWSDGKRTPGSYRVVQPVKVGLGDKDDLDTPLQTGALEMVVFDPDPVVRRSF